jgi:hypothetical protein
VGQHLDPVLAGLTHTDLVWRELLPMGGEPGADLVAAFDESIQENWFDPRTVVPVAPPRSASRTSWSPTTSSTSAITPSALRS